MLYWLGFEVLAREVSPFRVFQYSTFRTAMASITALALSLLLGPWLIARLREFSNQQHIRAEGPQSHQKKAGTPTMGGLLICMSILIRDVAVGESPHARRVGRDGLCCFVRRHRIVG